MDSLVISKMGALLAMICLTVGFSLLPYFLVMRGSNSLVSERRRHTVIRWFNCFGGGVFFGALLLHLMIEGAEEFEEYQRLSGFDYEFPFFNTFLAGGFFLVAFIEYFVHKVLVTRHDKPKKGASVDRANCCHDNDAIVGVVVEEKEKKKEAVADGDGGEECCCVKHECREAPTYGSIDKATTARFTKTISPENQSGDDDIASIGGTQQISFHTSTNNTIATTTTITSSRGSSNVMNNNRILNNNNTCNNNPVPASDASQEKNEELENSIASVVSEYIDSSSSGSPLRVFLLFAALSFHTVFDGLAVGLQTSTSLLWQMFTAIGIHKCIAGFCLGLEFFSKYKRAPRKAALWMFLFSLASPVGICIGIGLTSGGINDEAQHLSSGVLQGMASGTFMYVTFFEILSEAWNCTHTRSFLDISISLLGFASMAVVKYLSKEG